MPIASEIAETDTMWMHFHGQMSTQPSQRMHSAWSMWRNCFGFTAVGSQLGSTSWSTYSADRSGIGGFASNLRTIETLAAYLRGARPDVRAKYRLGLADLAVANDVGKCISYRVGDMQAKGRVPSHEGSALKVYHTELMQRLYAFGVSMLGLWGQLVPEDPRAPLEGAMPQSYMTASPASIYAGTNEIQRNIIAQRGLGLPRN